MSTIKTFAALALAALSPFGAAGAEYPDRPVRIVIPFPAGAAADAAMRVVGKKMSELLRQPVVLDNRPGVPGIQAVAVAQADGYTLLMGAGSSIVTHPLMSSKLVYDPKRDFVPVGRVLINTPVLTTHPSLGVRSVKELVALAKKKPGSLDFSSSGAGSPNHLAMELFQQMTGTFMVHIPYKGAAPAVTELVAGHVHLGINAIPSVMGSIKIGKLVPLAVASAKRSRALPDVPTIAEAGVPGFEYDIWYGLFAPSRTPPAVVAKVSAALQATLGDPEVARQLREQGAEPAPTTPQELARFIQQDTARWAGIIRERKLQLD
jgi:tripartite-type tricarboxylate transporter receptor subunit TctC